MKFRKSIDIAIHLRKINTTRFDWNIDKAKENENIHEDVTFEDAALVFFDQWSIEEFDDEHSEIDEKRFTVVGLSGNQILRVTFTVLHDENSEEIIRITTARKAEGKEKEDYEKARNEFDR